MRVHTMVMALACGGLALGGAACGGDQAGQSGDGATAGAPSQKPVRIAVVLPALDNEDSLLLKAGADEQARREKNVKVSVLAATANLAINEQFAKIQDAITNGADALAVVANQPDEFAPFLQRTARQGAKIVLVANDVAAFQERVSFIATDQVKAAKLDGEYMKQALPRGGTVGILHCLPGNDITDARVAGFMEGLAGAQGVKVVSTLDAKCDRAEGRKVMEDMLTSHPDLDALFSVSDTQTLGALPAIRAAGRKLIVASFDAQPEAVEAVKKGEISATVAAYARRIGAKAVEITAQVARGEQVPKVVDVPADLVTAENVATFTQ